MIKKEFVPLFKILSLHGLKGTLRVALLTFNVDLISAIKYLYLKEKWDTPIKLKSLKRAPGHNIYLINLEGVDYSQAQTLINQFLYIRLSDLPLLEEDEFYYYQLEDLRVIDLQGKNWGRVIAVIPMGDYALLLIENEKKILSSIGERVC